MWFSRSLRLIVCLCLALGAFRTASGQVWNRSLEPSTGFNDLCGEAIFAGGPNFSFTALHNADGPDPIVLTPEICAEQGDALLGTWANPEFYAANGFPQPDARLLNLLYSRVPIVIEPTGLRAFVPDHLPGVPQPIPPTRSLPNDPDTLADFLDVSGTMRLVCHDDGTADVDIRGRGYAPNAVLTVWVIWQNPPDSGLPPILPQSLGGAPNAVVADARGKFQFERALNFCPMEVQASGSVPLAIDVAKHLDGGNTYGSLPEVPLQTITVLDPETGEIFSSQGLGAGIVTVDQGVIPLLLDP